MKRAIVVICDGLRADMVTPELTPNLAALIGQGRHFTRHRSVFPSTTRTTSASIATGCLPARHGLEGNCVAIDEGDGLVALNVGHPNFRDRLRQATGHTLRTPTLAERLKDDSGSMVFSNVSPGAAYFQDPDGYGYVYHRDGSFGPGLEKLPEAKGLTVSHDADGDTAMTQRFCQEVLARRPRLAVLWQCEPDHTQHALPLGLPEHHDVIASADANAGRVAELVRDAAGNDDILLIVASDHGHETVEKVIPLESLLIEAGLKDSLESSDVVVASNGFSAHIYVSDEARERIGEIVRFLEGLDDIGDIFSGQDLARVGHRCDTPLAISVTAKCSGAVNEFGVPGKNGVFQDRLSGKRRLGAGQHGGLGAYEQGPFLIIRGGGFVAGGRSDEETSAIDIAPTILRHLNLPWSGMDGKPLSRN